MCAKDRRHQGDGPWDAPSSAAPQVARTGSCTETIVNHLLKKHSQSVHARAGSLRAGFLQPEAEAGARAEKIQEVEDKQKGLQVAGLHVPCGILTRQRRLQVCP